MQDGRHHKGRAINDNVGGVMMLDLMELEQRTFEPLILFCLHASVRLGGAVEAFPEQASIVFGLFRGAFPRRLAHRQSVIVQSGR